MNLAQIGEFGLIESLQNGLKTRAGTQLGIGDDCAVLEGLQTPIVTLDALVEGVHFRRDWTSPRALGRKAMAASVSDLAASGARPVAAFVSLCLGARDDFEFIGALYEGFEDAAEQFGFTIAGGDTTRSKGDLVLSITLIGEVMNAKRGPILRSGAQIGDQLWVTGTLGDSAAGLAILQSGDDAQNRENPAHLELESTTRNYLLQRHHEPMPRLQWVKRLLELDAEAVHAALDLSDGLVGDAAHVARRSGVQLEIEVERLPISLQCREAAQILGFDALDWALSGGEDYEILLTVAPKRAGALHQKASAAGIALTQIGEVESPNDEAPVVVRQNGELRASGRAWTHF